MFQWGHTLSYGNNANRTGGNITVTALRRGFTISLFATRLTASLTKSLRPTSPASQVVRGKMLPS